MLFKKVVPVVLALFLFWMFFSIWTEAVQAAKGGEPGKPGGSIPGAGNIAFVSGWDVLTTDGQAFVVIYPEVPSGTFSWVRNQDVEIDVPIPVSDIVYWSVYNFLDKDGQFWQYDYDYSQGEYDAQEGGWRMPEGSQRMWINFGHP